MPSLPVNFCRFLTAKTDVCILRKAFYERDGRMLRCIKSDKNNSIVRFAFGQTVRRHTFPLFDFSHLAYFHADIGTNTADHLRIDR